MIIATIARKSFDGTVVTNAGKHGTGGINIDACRIFPTGERLGGGDESAKTLDGKVSCWSRPWMHDPEKAGSFAVEMRNRVEKATVLGRWPANLVLFHLGSCQKSGVGRMKGTRKDGRPEGDDGRADTTQWRFRPSAVTRRGYSGKDGMETVDSWACTEGCPVAEMDRQSGFSFSPVPDVHVRAGHGPSRAKGAELPHPTVSGHGDFGGSARFFKQVRK